MKKIITIAIVLTLAMLATSAYAREIKQPDSYYSRKGISDNIMISAGFYLPTLSTNVRVDSTYLGQGTDIGFENMLDMDSSVMVLRADGHFRFFDWFSLQLGYYNISRSTTTTLNESIQFGNKTYTVNADVTGLFATEVIKAALAFSLLNDGNVEFGFSVGGNIIFLEASLSSYIGNVSESVDEIAPLPLGGLFANFTISPGLFLKGTFEYFSLSIDDIDGTALDCRAVIEYYPLDNIGIGAGVNLFDINISMKNIKVSENGIHDTLSGKFDYTTTGLVAYLSVVL